MVSLDIPSFVIGVLGVVFVFNPQFVAFWSWISRKIRSRLRPGQVQCDSLRWKDVQSGLLHHHSGQPGLDQCSYCSESRVHHDGSDCWHKTLAIVFNNAWENPKRRKYVPKPAQLPLDETFLQTEARVILAYFLCTANITYFSEEQLGSSRRFLDLQERDGLLIAHLGPAGRTLDLTKEEVDSILAGWPPFYRATFMSHEGHLLSSPIETFDHVRRPGWIAAIGLGRVQPTDVFVDNSTDRERSLFNWAITRTRRVLEEQFAREWSGNAVINKAIQSITNMLAHGKSDQLVLSRDFQSVSDTISYPKAKDYSSLTKSQCEALIRVFHEMTISADDKAILDPVLEECMHRIRIGVAAVLQYTSATRALTIPPSLRGDRVVYVRGCQPDED